MFLTLLAASMGALLVAWIEPGPLGGAIIVAVCVALTNLLGALAASLAFVLLADEDARQGEGRRAQSRRLIDKRRSES